MKKVEKERKKNGTKLATLTGHQYFYSAEITHIKASDDDCLIFTLESEKPILAKYNLKEIAGQFPVNTFIRCHHSYLFNPLHYKELCPKGKCILLKNGTTVSLSKRKRNDVEKQLDEYFNMPVTGRKIIKNTPQNSVQNAKTNPISPMKLICGGKQQNTTKSANNEANEDIYGGGKYLITSIL